MSQAEFLADNPYATFGMTAAEAPAEARLGFIRKTYTHLAAAVYALVMLEFLFFFTLPLDAWMPRLLMAGGGWGWLVVLGAFMVVSWIANAWAQSETSIGKQYAGLFLYVAAEAVILCPLLWIANHYVTPIGEQTFSPILVAAIATLLVFGVLTATVFITRHDFSYLGPILGIAGLVLLGVILLSAFGLMNFGVLIMSAFVVFACGYILYYTSNVLHHYRTDQHVAAALALFASVALLFWYILQIVLSLSSRD
jgi:FtsH-binding integral membrane protein